MSAVPASWRCENPFEQRSGTLLVLGSAPCVLEDVLRAMDLRPGAEKLAINEAGGAVRDIQHLLAGHCYHADYYLEYRRRKFPDAPRVLVHASYRAGREIPPCVTHRWTGVATGGTSAWKAVRIGKALGYTEIILCGCPMEATGYFTAGEDTGVPHDCMRFGAPGKERGDLRKFDNYRNTFAIRASQEGTGVYSMSGWSQEKLGEPPA